MVHHLDQDLGMDIVEKYFMDNGSVIPIHHCHTATTFIILFYWLLEIWYFRRSHCIGHEPRSLKFFRKSDKTHKGVFYIPESPANVQKSYIALKPNKFVK